MKLPNEESSKHSVHVGLIRIPTPQFYESNEEGSSEARRHDTRNTVETGGGEGGCYVEKNKNKNRATLITRLRQLHIMPNDNSGRSKHFSTVEPRKPTTETLLTTETLSDDGKKTLLSQLKNFFRQLRKFRLIWKKTRNSGWLNCIHKNS